MSTINPEVLQLRPELEGILLEVCYIIAAHAGEVDMVERSTEASSTMPIAFLIFLPFKQRSRT